MLFTDLNASRARAPGDAKSGDLGGFGGCGGKDCVLERHEYRPFGSGGQRPLLERERAASIQQYKRCFWFRMHREHGVWMAQKRGSQRVLGDLEARIVFMSSRTIRGADLEPKGCFWSENGPLESSSASVVSGFERIASDAPG